LETGFGGPSDFGVDFVGVTRDSGSDDDSSAAVDITPVFDQGLQFGGQTFTALFVNNNGNVSFGAPLSDATPFALEGAAPAAILAPFFADVDTTGAPVAASAGGTSSGANLTWYAVDPDSGRVTVTWDDVGYAADGTDKLNAVQLQLIDRGSGDYDVLFRYEDVNWTTGEASGGSDGLGGTVARAGFSAGNGADFFELAGSGDQTAMLALDETPGSNAVPGVRLFEFRSFGDGRLLSTPDASYLTDFNDVIGDPFGGNVLGGPDAGRDLRADAAMRTSVDGQSWLSLDLDGSRYRLPIADGSFEVETLELPVAAGEVPVRGRGFADLAHRFAYYALDRTAADGSTDLGAFAVDPAATFLRAESFDAPNAPMPIRLADLGIQPGDVLVLTQRGDLSLAQSVGDPPLQVLTSAQVSLVPAAEVAGDLLGLFSSSAEVLDDTSRRNRVPGAIDAGLDTATPTLGQTGQPTDIPEDFRIGRFADAQTLVVPEGAAYLFLMPADTFLSDNSDADADLFVDAATYLPGARAFLMTGVPTPNGGLIESDAANVATFELGADPFTGSAIPFLPAAVAESFPTPAVSPAYLLRRQGALVLDTGNNVFPGPGVPRSRFLQASFAVAGSGADQQSALVLSETPLALSNEDKVFISSGVRGSVRRDATQPRLRVSADAGSLASATGDHFFGADQQYFVLTNNGIGQDDATPDLDYGAGFLVASDLDTQDSTTYGFLHVADRVATPDGVGTVRTAGTLNGYAAGMAQTVTFGTPDAVSTPFDLQAPLDAAGAADPGSVRIRRHPTNSTVSARFDLADTGDQSGTLDTARFTFGGNGTTTGSLVDDRIFGARQARTANALIDGAPGRNLGFAAPSGMRGAMVSAETMLEPGAEILGQATCTCEYLTWGLWSSELVEPDDSARHHVHIGSWVAGDLPEPGDLPSMGTASYTGHAIGEVYDGQNQYLAVGRFRNDWDFAARQGRVRIDAFDGRDFAGTADAVANPRDYTGTLAGPDGISGSLEGSFFRGGDDPAAATGGQFRLQGEVYRATGTFAGEK
jgi:hypothetical protein